MLFGKSHQSKTSEKTLISVLRLHFEFCLPFLPNDVIHLRMSDVCACAFHIKAYLRLRCHPEVTKRCLTSGRGGLRQGMLLHSLGRLGRLRDGNARLCSPRVQTATGKAWEGFERLWEELGGWERREMMGPTIITMPSFFLLLRGSCWSCG